MREVSQDEFWRWVCERKRDMVSTAVGEYPYDSVFRDRGTHAVVGMIKSKMIDSVSRTDTYYLAESEEVQ